MAQCENTLKEIDNLNKLTSVKEIESLIDNCPKQRAQVPNDFPINSKIHFRKILFQSTEAERILLTFFYETIIILILKPGKTLQENYRLISVINTYATILNKILTKRPKIVNTILKKNKAGRLTPPDFKP